MIIPLDQDLSLEEMGLLSTMINVIEADYATIDFLTANSSDTKETVNNIIQNLITKGYVFKIKDKFAVNKDKIPAMTLIK